MSIFNSRRMKKFFNRDIRMVNNIWVLYIKSNISLLNAYDIIAKLIVDSYRLSKYVRILAGNKKDWKSRYPGTNCRFQRQINYFPYKSPSFAESFERDYRLASCGKTRLRVGGEHGSLNDSSITRARGAMQYVEENTGTKPNLLFCIANRESDKITCIRLRPGLSRRRQ